MTAASKLILAVPSKGRLQENAFSFFARAGLNLAQGRGARDYRGVIAGLDDVEVAFLSASEITRELAQGGVHLGVTGEDLIRESVGDVDARLVLLTPLGFGHANVVVAVPQAWIDVRSMADLADVASSFRARHGHRLRVATKYINLTRRFFASHGIADYRIVESGGATEGAPAAGSAELIVDITTTGATLSANALKIVDDGVMLKSEANLVASRLADWSPTAREAAKAILSRIAAEEEARTHREVRVLWPAPPPEALIADAIAQFGIILVGGERERGRTTFHCPVGKIFPLSDWLVARGAGRVAVSAIDYVFTPQNGLADALFSKIT
jgi:ATP phosphoribosyltransferase